MDDPFGEHVALSDADPRWARMYTDEASRIGAAILDAARAWGRETIGP